MLQRARLFVVGEGGAGKTTLIRALRDLPFEDTNSTAGIDTSTLETTDMQDWIEINGTEHEKVILSFQKSNLYVVSVSLIQVSFYARAYGESGRGLVGSTVFSRRR